MEGIEMSLTRVGVHRSEYAAIESAPSRFYAPVEFSQWAQRADNWARANSRETLDNQACQCGHKNISHGSTRETIGGGACGIDRDTRNALTGYLGDPCPCKAFAL